MPLDFNDAVSFPVPNTKAFDHPRTAGLCRHGNGECEWRLSA